MKIWTALDQVPGQERSVVTIGNFDGVHRGHQRVITACVTRARKHGVEAVACTFDPHPIQVHFPQRHLSLICSVQDRLDLLSATGLDASLVIHYDQTVFTLDAEEFVATYLVDRLGAVEVVVGEDFRFGRNNEGDVETLRKLGRSFGFDVVVVADILGPEGRRWSSSWVRELLAQGDVAGAAQVLGHLHRIRGTVMHGFKRGRQLGFPTANLTDDIEGEVPSDGVYAGWLIRQVPGTSAGEFLPAAISVGTNPQFNGEKRTVEAHVLGRSDLNLYGERIAISFVDFIRPMMMFDSVEALTDRMDDDLRQTAQSLGVAPANRVDPSAVSAQ